MMKYILQIFFLFILLETLYSDSPRYKRPFNATDNHQHYVAEIFQSNSRLRNKKSVCYFYEIEFDINLNKYRPQDRFRLIWNGELVNSKVPSKAIISSNGYLVTIDDYYYSGKDHAVVLYNKEGTLLKDFSLDQLIPEEDRLSFVISSSSIFWRNNAKYYFCNPIQKNESQKNPTHLYIVLKSGKVIEIPLEIGDNNYSDISNFPFLDSLVSQKFTKEMYYGKSSELKYSSITELLNCRNTK